ncbi:hypothetical protein EYF80_010480 [Liparis tanakae]|uniref:Uncharacterized protein n=1 Tax=Liparis tanakae TaxID=230148 RepID=A0A4Z2IMZ6_9TELE|nr:hypothetical protein EYF80_010480 [Liparis tanakae]
MLKRSKAFMQRNSSWEICSSRNSCERCLIRTQCSMLRCDTGRLLIFAQYSVNKLSLFPSPATSHFPQGPERLGRSPDSHSSFLMPHSSCLIPHLHIYTKSISTCSFERANTSNLRGSNSTDGRLFNSLLELGYGGLSIPPGYHCSGRTTLLSYGLHMNPGLDPVLCASMHGLEPQP